ncbi:MAG: hypothetical protein ED557_04940 [Balneola sp.]|nr:MAG: hypothetical protein ED557_04940 [Balneola sp.]
MKIYFTILKVVFFLFLFLEACFGQEKKESASIYLEYPKEILDFATEIDVKPISNELFQNPSIYGGQGTPYLFDIITRSYNTTTDYFDNTPRPASFLFWGIKEEQKYLIFVVDSKKDPYDVEYEIRSMISITDYLGIDFESLGIDPDYSGSFGMIAYDGIFGFNKDLSEFRYLTDRTRKGPEGIFPTILNGSVPVIIYGEAAITVLYYYKNEWLIYEEIDI